MAAAIFIMATTAIQNLIKEWRDKKSCKEVGFFYEGGLDLWFPLTFTADGFFSLQR